MKARRRQNQRQRAIWANAIRTETSRQGDKPVSGKKRLDICQLTKIRKKRLAEERSTERHDKMYRRAVKAKRVHTPHSFVETSVCDVELYHARRMEAAKINPAQRDAVVFRWIAFEQKYKKGNAWTAPQAGRVAGPNNLFAHFQRSHSQHSLHRWLIHRCRKDVWLDKGLDTLCNRISDNAHNQSFLSRCCQADIECTRFSLMCTECGTTRPRVRRKDMNMKELDCIQEIAPSYKRNNHLHEWITRVQARERKVVPRQVKEAVLTSFNRWGFDRNNPTKTLVRKFLRDAGYQRYFEHVPQIMQWLSGKQQIMFTDATVRQIKHVFSAIQVPFERHKPSGRKNFLSYSYVLYKVCELLELDDILHAFTLLKSRANLMKADVVWKGICKDCGYQFIPTT